MGYRRGAVQGWWVRYWYHLTTALGLALDSIRTHKLRSFLTLLGIIIGVASVVVVGAAIEGLGVYAEESTSKVFGSETYVIAQVAGVRSRKEFFDHIRRNKPIRTDDLRFLEATTGDLIHYSPYQFRAADVTFQDLNYEDATILGVAASLPEMREINLIEGRFFTEQEDRTKQAVAVLGDDVRARLFPTSSAVERKVRIQGLEFRVLGVQEKLGSSFGRNQDNIVYIPHSLFIRLYGTAQSVVFFGRARPASRLSLLEALDVTRTALRTRFRLAPGAPDRFDSITPDSIRSFIDQILGVISAVVVPITCMSLVVGGIVIMNIMLVSVTERTHEIGIRKSLGARMSDIRLQFLLEAILLAAAGGLAGLLAGAGLVQMLASIFEIRLRITPAYVFMALLVSSTVGIVSGWYPARRASRLDPVVALRAE
jgi:putative ABC transport system permease protein